MGYLYGEVIKYEYDLIKPEDYELLQAFSCGNEKMDHFIHDEMIKDGIVDSDDGLPFKVWNSEKREVFAIFQNIWKKKTIWKLIKMIQCTWYWINSWDWKGKKYGNCIRQP